MRDRIRSWQAGDILGLWSDFLANEEKRSRCRGGPRNLSHPDALQISNVRRVKRSIEAGQYRKGIQALTSEGLVPASAKILEEMLSKHPQSPSPPPHPPLPHPPLSSTKPTLRRYVPSLEIPLQAHHCSELTTSGRLFTTPPLIATTTPFAPFQVH